MELRCTAKLHGLVIRDGIIEVKCDSRFCGAGKGVTVLHRFDVTTGKLVETATFKDPGRKENPDAVGKHNAPLRAS